MLFDTPPFIPGIVGGRTVTTDFDDAYSDLFVIERTDMVTARTMRIVSRYRTNEGASVWVTRLVAFNALDECIYIQKLAHSDVPPAFVPSGVVP